MLVGNVQTAEDENQNNRDKYWEMARYQPKTNRNEQLKNRKRWFLDLLEVVAMLQTVLILAVFVVAAVGKIVDCKPEAADQGRVSVVVDQYQRKCLHFRLFRTSLKVLCLAM